MHLVESNSNKSSSILKLIPISGMVTNQAGSPSIGPNNTNVSRNSRENMVTIDSAIRNEEIEKLNRDIKIGLEV